MGSNITMKKLLVYFSMLVFMCSAAFAGDKIEILQTELGRLNLINPLQDLTDNIDRDDFRFMGLYGYAVYYPGISGQDLEYVDTYKSILFKGTSDAIESKHHARLIKEAKHYAKVYNEALLRRLKKHSVLREEGYVPNEKTAIAIAVAVWNPIYGEEKIKKEKPYSAMLSNGIWFVSGSLPEGYLGGVAEIEILKKNGKVIRLSHGK